MPSQVMQTWRPHAARSLPFWLAVCLTLAAAPARTQTTPEGRSSPKTVRVATRVLPPFVTDSGGKLGGFSIELWNRIGERLNLRTEYLPKPGVRELLTAVKDGEAGVGIAAISITSERIAEFDFSQPMFDSGLEILVRAQSGGGTAFPSFFSVVFAPALLQLLGIALLLILIPAHIIWFAERRCKDGIIEHEKYFPGILKALWWSAGTLGAQADEMPRSTLGRIIALIWMFGSITFVAYFTAAVTTALTVQQLQGNIRGPEDLPGKKVATTAASTSARYLREQHAQVLEFEKIDDAYDTLLQKKADAVVFDAPVLLHYAARDGKGRVQVVGATFRKENYGIALPQGSALRKRIDSALLGLREDGTYQELYDKWFSEK
jgi:polar amino acid transport system substrate-binding protein